MTAVQAVVALLDLIHSDLLRADGDAWERLAEATDKGYALSGGEQAIVGFAAAIWAASGQAGSVGLLGTLDKPNRLAVLTVLAEYYGGMA